MNAPQDLPTPRAVITRDRVDGLAEELLEWAEGRRSHLNEFMSLEASPEDRQQTLVHVAQADAAEVQRLAAALSVLRSEVGR